MLQQNENLQSDRTSMILILNSDQVENWLYYESGFEQMHPHPGIIAWMEEQGYRYQHDWKCYRTISKRDYHLQFPNDEVQTMFVLRWS